MLRPIANRNSAMQSVCGAIILELAVRVDDLRSGYIAIFAEKVLVAKHTFHDASGVKALHWARATNENVMDSVHAPVGAFGVTIDEWDPDLSDAHSVNGYGATDGICGVLR